MKKHLPNSLRALFLSLALLLSLPMLAVEVEIGGISYELKADAKQATVVAKSDKYSGDVVIPESVEHESTAYSVTSIGEEAFDGCSGLTSVTIPNSVTSIGEYAFASCSGLTSVTIPYSVTSIGGGAFEDCSGLTSIVVEEGNTFYDSRNNCNAIIETASNSLICGCNTSIIPNGVTSIVEYAFYACSGLTSVTIPNSVTSIGDCAFQSCSGLTSVTIGNGVESIGSNAFQYCSGLTSVTIGNGVESIGKFAFYHCPELLNVYCYAENVPSTDSYAFDSRLIKNATLHVPAGSVYSYTANAPWKDFGTIVALPPFSGEVEIDGINYELNGETLQAAVMAKSSGKYYGEIVIPESVEHDGTAYRVTSIADSAFFECSSLKSVTIPNSVTSIEKLVFANCFRLTSVHISDIAAWCNIKFDDTCANPLGYAGHLYINGEEVKDLVIPNSVTSIGDYAFDGCSGLTSVTIPNSVTSIGDRAFHACTGLTSVTIPNTVISIGEETFNFCYGLTSVTIGNSVTSIGDRAFRSCSGLTSVTILNSVTSIGNYAFDGCSGLTSVTIGNSVTSIGHGAFYGCSSLESVIIPNSVTSIGQNPFANCSSLNSIVVEENNSFFDSRDNCNAIVQTGENILLSGCVNTTIPNNIAHIGGGAFSGCSGLTSATIPNSVTSIGDGAFANCPGLTSVTIPNSVKSIGNSAFSRCSGLTSATIPNSVTSMGDHVFNGCSGLKYVTIGDSVTSIGYQAFSDCSSLTSLAVGKSVTNIGDYAFGNCFKLKTIYNLSALNFTQGSLDYGWIARYAVYVINIPNGSLEGNFIFSVTDGKNVLCRYLGNETEPILPENCKGETYVIGSDVFKHNATIVSLIIPNSVTSIEDEAFSGCFGLTSVTIPNSVKSIGDGAFLASTRLTSVHITDLAAWCNIEFGSSTANPLGWAQHLYINGEDVKDLAIPDSVTSIGKYAFYRFSALTSVTIPNSVTTIEAYAFRYCDSLASVTIGNGLTAIGNETFYECQKLKTVYNFSNLSFIRGRKDHGYVAYYANNVINVPNGFFDGDYIFSVIDGKNALCGYIGNETELTLPENYKGSAYEIGSNAFNGNNALTSVIIGDSVTGIGNAAFAYCSGLNSITIPNSVASIGSSAFSNCSALTSVTIPNSVTSIEGSTFRGCSGLTSVTIGNSVTSIGEEAFSFCGLASVSIPDSVISVGQKAFYACSTLTSVTIGNGVRDIYSNAFANCPELLDVYCYAEVAPSTKRDAFIGSYPEYSTLYVPHTSIEDYKKEAPWSTFGTIKAIPGTERYTITFMLEGTEFHKDTLVAGSSITLPEAPEKEGHSFNGWKDVPETMPANDVVVVGSYSVNKYLLTFKIGDEVIASDSIEYGAKVETPQVAEKEGHTFNGWKDIPETMPANDVVVVGSYSVNKYLLTFKIWDKVIVSDSIEYGAKVETPQVPEKEGHTFSGWENVPETMPANDVVVVGSYSVNKYLLTFKIGDEVLSADSVEYGAKVETPQVAEKEGHTFNGWENVPETMPANDVVVVGSYSVNKYLLTFKIGDEVIASDSVEYGAKIETPQVAEKEGHTFNGWKDIPETMPANDVVVVGSYTVNIYKVYYYVGDELVHTEEVAYGDNIPSYEYTPTNGDKFMGWDGEQYDTMPAHDVTYIANIESGILYINGDMSEYQIYDLNGRKIENAKNLKSGVYIVNGKKTIVKAN